ncbi:hypothetical protein SD72_12370 [Leucobacter komagatae]|uniref:Uncharacterized protein n=1 Tax=Leucobacter komagatae TaxID=55969 RepID=A0A0D0ILC2_9MICO|nr:hypothetical protein SD72_12370 [Leucobacter komagatae]
MAGGDEILVDEEARGIMLALGKHDPGTPGSMDVARVTGPASSAGTQSYRLAMQDVGAGAHLWFLDYLGSIRRDCANGAKALDDFTAQDAEIMALLRQYEEEAASVASQSSSQRASSAGGEPLTTPELIVQENPGGSDVTSWGKPVGG